MSASLSGFQNQLAFFPVAQPTTLISKTRAITKWLEHRPQDQPSSTKVTKAMENSGFKVIGPGLNIYYPKQSSWGHHKTTAEVCKPWWEHSTTGGWSKPQKEQEQQLCKKSITIWWCKRQKGNRTTTMAALTTKVNSVLWWDHSQEWSSGLLVSLSHHRHKDPFQATSSASLDEGLEIWLRS